MNIKKTIIMSFRITQPIFHKVLHSGFHDEVYVDGESRELMLEIKKALSVFEPIDDDEARKNWLEIPRGTAEEWRTFNGNHWGYDGLEGLSAYQEALDEEYPYGKEWFFLSTSTYKENTFLKISDVCHLYVIFSNRNLKRHQYADDMTWFLKPLLELVRQRVESIASDPEAYHQYIEANLPYRQRSGKIRSKDINKIIPKMKLQVENREYCIQVMKEFVRRKQAYESVKTGEPVSWRELGVPAPFDSMSIRRFCKYYRIADTIYWSGSDYDRATKAVSIEDDVEYYTSHGLHQNLKEYDLDSEEDFKRFAKDHYGELGLSRMNVGASQYYAGGKWLVTFGISYSASVPYGLKIAMALYETEAPFVFHDAETLLHVLEESGTVRLSPFTYHDYLGSGDDEGVFSLPYVEDCRIEGEVTREQYDEIVRLAEWEPKTKLKLDGNIPLDDAVYDMVRDDMTAPATLSEIRVQIEKKYDTYLAVERVTGNRGYRYINALRNRSLSVSEKSQLYPTFNEALRALILEMNSTIRKQETRQ